MSSHAHHHSYRMPSQRSQEEGDAIRRCSECHWRERSITLPYVPPGSNAIKRMHFQEVARWRRQIRDDMALLLIGQPKGLVERGRLTLDFRWRSKAKRDPLNFAEGCKAAIDALVGVWLVDDDAEHLEAVVRGRVGTGQDDCVVLTLEAR